jgi:6-phosphogluconolactonase
VSSPPTADEAPAIEAAVAAFEDELRALVPADDADGVPSLDIVLLGFGPDGHTASLFPGTAAAQESERLAAWCMPGPGIAPQVPRITVTRRIIQAAKNVIVLATGADKAWVVRDIFSEAVENSIVGEAPRSVARLVRNCRGKVTMLLDDKIASGLPQ